MQWKRATDAYSFLRRPQDHDCSSTGHIDPHLEIASEVGIGYEVPTPVALSKLENRVPGLFALIDLDLQ